MSVGSRDSTGDDGGANGLKYVSVGGGWNVDVCLRTLRG